MNIRTFKPSFAGLAMLAAMCGYAAAQTAPQDPAPAVQTTQNLRLMSANAQLAKSVSTKDATQGQTVTAKLTSSVKADGVKLDKGTMLIGRVEQVQKPSGNSPAKLALVFNEARLSNGKTIPVKATLLGAYPQGTMDYWVNTTTSGSLLPIQPRTIPSDQKVDQEPGTLSHVAMHSAVQSSASGVFTSKDHDINLKRGTRFQIAIAPETMTAG